MDYLEIKKAVEVIIFASDEPLDEKNIHKIIDEVDIDLSLVQQAIKDLANCYSHEQYSFELIYKANGWQFASKREMSPWIRKLFKGQSNQKLTARAVETLSIIAYKQPISKSIIEDIRGVNSDGIVKSLLEKELITVVGREKTAGNPMLYGTTKKFLLHFGLESIKELPNLKEIDDLLKSDDKLEKEYKILEANLLGIQNSEINTPGSDEK